jgi:hypothetical protein
MIFKAYSEEQKDNIVNSICNDIQRSLTPITELCKQKGIVFRTIERWCDDKEEWHAMLIGAVTQRAWRYAEDAIGIIDNVQPFFEDNKGNRHDSNASVNKAKHQAEFRLKLAEILAPDTFGNLNLRYEIKEAKMDIKEIKKAMGAMGIKTK